MRSSIVFCIAVIGAIALGVALFIGLIGGPSHGATTAPAHSAAQFAALSFEPVQPVAAPEEWKGDEAGTQATPVERLVLERSPFIDYGFALPVTTEPETKTTQPAVKSKPQPKRAVHTHPSDTASGNAPSPWDAFKDGNRYQASAQYRNKEDQYTSNGYSRRSNPYAGRMSVSSGRGSAHRYSSRW
jgi:hypothetical protein